MIKKGQMEINMLQPRIFHTYFFLALICDIGNWFKITTQPFSQTHSMREVWARLGQVERKNINQTSDIGQEHTLHSHIWWKQFVGVKCLYLDTNVWRNGP